MTSAWEAPAAGGNVEERQPRVDCVIGDGPVVPGAQDKAVLLERRLKSWIARLQWRISCPVFRDPDLDLSSNTGPRIVIGLGPTGRNQ